MKKLIALFAASALSIGACAGDNLLKSEDFSKENGWQLAINKAISDNGGKVDFVAGSAVCSVPTVDKQVNHWMQIKKNVELEKNKSYLVKFKIKSDKAGKIDVAYIMYEKPWTSYAAARVEIDQGEKVYTVKLTPKADKNGDYKSPRMVDFHIGTMAGAVMTFSEVSIEETK